MERRSWYIIFLLTLTGFGGFAQQDAQYSQYIFNAVYINPAYAGFRERLNFNATYRNQWTGINGAPKSFSLAVDALMPNERVGLSLTLGADQLGAQKNLSAFANYAYRFPVDEDETSKLAFGLGVGFQQFGIYGDMHELGDEGDNSLSLTTMRKLVPDVRAGVFFSTPKMYVGASVNNLIGKYILDKKKLDFNFPTPEPHFYLTGGALFPVVEYEIDFKPVFLIKDDAAGPTVLDLNAFFLFKQKLWIGGGYRTGIKLYDKPAVIGNVRNPNALIGMAEFFVNDNLRIGYSYDHSLGGLAGYSGSTHEISVSWNFLNERERRINFCYF
ncbi:type IX secretion system membrane protein PorP/SprF [Pedobacter xixiisoli]|uniref:Type IX secretion system membrane protein, PorP/SprF family n=1 Tax=Pedobacter xixiisoli TaxID=1476464 RepID=A0A285ZXK6_9SPHI|nr:type IX secretion system membrane protein PorP/SprF [Pedobacter xixiisoli]SOD14394.1 type IX secretion system membrane protein, PorP/SprF family [Pedobacter xixiisoli]